MDPAAATTDAWVLRQRGPKASLDPFRAYAAIWEEEPDAAGVLAPTAVILLTNRECPFRCVMCDLWVNTLDARVPAGAIQTQIRSALATLPPATQIKLYNAGSFFDPQAIPAADDEAIAEEVRGFERLIVEAHPAFLAGAHGERCVRFSQLLRGQLEVAIGLETANPAVLARMNKRMTLDSFQRAAEFLQANGIDLRVFILLNPPFLPAAEGVEWACRSLDLAAACGATAASVIPTRGGNGAMEALGSAASRPRVNALEQAVEYGLSLPGMRVFSDLWDIERFHDCACSPARSERLRAMNLTQRVPDPVVCECTARAIAQP